MEQRFGFDSTGLVCGQDRSEMEWAILGSAGHWISPEETRKFPQNFQFSEKLDGLLLDLITYLAFRHRYLRPTELLTNNRILLPFP